MSARIIGFHHRLGGMIGHRNAEASGIRAAVAARGLGYMLFVKESASAEVLAEFPDAHAVLNCPVFFDGNASFDARSADLVAMLHRHLDPIVRPDDRVLLTTAFQCDTHAVATWLAEIPASRRPWTLVIYHNDRWNRFGPQECDRQRGEFRVTAATLARLGRDAAHRLMVGSVVDELRPELGRLLGIDVHLVPHMKPAGDYVAPRQRQADEPPVVGLLGGARREKGSDRIPAIIAEVRKLGRVDFAVQIANEDLPPAALEQLCLIEGQPDVTVIHGPLDLATYHSLLARIDLLLLPYERIPYRTRASGPFVESCVIGRPSVVPSGTWMGDQVAAGKAAGVIYAGDDPTAIAAAVMRAAADFPALASLAQAHAPAWKRTRTCDPFLDWLECEIARRESASWRPGGPVNRPGLRRRASDLVARVSRWIAAPARAPSVAADEE
ncbi:MAG TPA: hypothetical protein VII40_10000 [Xanthobacteraceae bacterium]